MGWPTWPIQGQASHANAPINMPVRPRPNARLEPPGRVCKASQGREGTCGENPCSGDRSCTRLTGGPSLDAGTVRHASRTVAGVQAIPRPQRGQKPFVQGVHATQKSFIHRSGLRVST